MPACGQRFPPTSPSRSKGRRSWQWAAEAVGDGGGGVSGGGDEGLDDGDDDGVWVTMKMCE